MPESIHSRERTSYTAVYNRGDFYQGDTIPALSIRLEESLEFDGTRRILKPEAIEVKLNLGTIVKDHNAIIREDGYVILDPITSNITKDLDPGRYEYHVIYKLPNDTRKTYVTGSFNILRSFGVYGCSEYSNDCDFYNSNTIGGS